MTGARIIHKVAVMAAYVASQSGYHSIGACACGVAVTDATAAAQAVYHFCTFCFWIRRV